MKSLNLKTVSLLLISVLLFSCSDIGTEAKSNEENSDQINRRAKSSIVVRVSEAKTLLRKVVISKTNSKSGRKHQRRWSKKTRINLPFEVINFDLSDDITEIDLSDVKAGTYEKFLTILRRPYSKRVNISDADFVDGKNRYSMVIKGKVNKDNFVFKTKKLFWQNLNFTNPVDVTDGNAKVAIVANSNTWFIDSVSGDYLDPNDPSNHDTIVANIRASLKIETEYDPDASSGGGL